MAQDNQKTIEAGAMTLVLLTKNYKSQMVALLLKNGVVVPNGASDEQITSLIVKLLKVSKSFYNDLNDFLKNPKVLNNIAGNFGRDNQYYSAGGFSVPDFNPKPLDLSIKTDYGLGTSSGTSSNSYFNTTLTTPTTPTTETKTGGGFWSGGNFFDLLKTGLDTITKIDTNKTDREIANAQVIVSGGSSTGSSTGDSTSSSVNENPKKDGVSTTTIVVVSLVGIAVISTIAYFIVKAKK